MVATAPATRTRYVNMEPQLEIPAIQGTGLLHRARPHSTKDMRLHASHRPVKIINGGQNLESSYKPAEFSFAAQGYSKLIEVPTVAKSPKPKVVGTFAGRINSKLSFPVRVAREGLPPKVNVKSSNLAAAEDTYSDEL